ncbi:MAG: hypothetical protein ACYTGV_16975, partial [Planctomycetota bacterium]
MGGDGPSFLGIPARQVKKPSWQSFTEGVERATQYLPAWRRGDDGEMFFGQSPSRGTVRDLAGVQSPDPKDIENRLAEEYAKNEAARVAAGEAPRNTTDPADPPTDEKEPKVGTGPLAVAPTDKEGKPTASTYDDYGIVRMPDGRIIATGGGGEGLVSQGGSRLHEGQRANVAEGAAGSVFSSAEAGLAGLIGPGGADLADVNLPTDEDRSPGWAVRKAYRDLYASGDLSMDPRDIMDRRRWEEQEEARESDLELARARRDAAIRQSQVDPYRMAQIEAEGKYGGEVLKQEGKQRQMMVALQYYAEVGSRISAAEEQLSQVPPDSAQAAALQEQIDRLTQERRELANIALGFN